MGPIGFLFNEIFTFPIFNALVVLYRLFGDFGLAIVVLTLVIRLILFPLTLQQLKSMKANQALQPKMQEIKKKYANDQQGQMLATQALYKEYGINPVAGCLPLLIQMPVLYGLYFALNGVLRSTTHSVKALNDELYPFVAPFAHFPNTDLRWFSWLSALNPIFGLHWNWSISLGSPDPTHILPILAALATFIQLRMSQPKLPPGTKPNNNDPTQQTTKMMQYIMPLFTGFLGWTFPAGLALYWTVGSVFQAVQQYFVTGWGSLLVKPNLPISKDGEVEGSIARETPANNSNRRSKLFKLDAQPALATTIDTTTTEETYNDTDSSDGAITRNLKTNSTTRSNGSGGSQYSRRQRGGSASARRRNGNTQKARR